MTLVVNIRYLKLNFLAQALVIPGLFLFSSCNSKKMEHIVGQTMGTTFSVKYVSDSALPKRDELSKKINELLFEVNRQMSTYMFESEISALNRAKENQIVSISSDFAHVLKFSLDLAKKTDGAYDPTIGPLVNLWGFGPEGKRVVPSEKDLLETKKFIGYHLINLKAQNVSKKDHRVYVDLSSSAKGFGVDKIARFLESKGIHNYMVEIGGEIRTKGAKDDNSPWLIAIEAPHKKDGRIIQQAFEFSDLSIATSGNYRNFFTQENKAYSHTINYKTGRPVEHTLASVSVIRQDGCMEADALTTALMALGPIKGFEFATEHGIGAYFILKLDHESQFKVKKTKAFDKLLGQKQRK